MVSDKITVLHQVEVRCDVAMVVVEVVQVEVQVVHRTVVEEPAVAVAAESVLEVFEVVTNYSKITAAFVISMACLCIQILSSIFAIYSDVHVSVCIYPLPIVSNSENLFSLSSSFSHMLEALIPNLVFPPSSSSTLYLKSLSFLPFVFTHWSNQYRRIFRLDGH